MPLENVLPPGADTLLIIEGVGGFHFQARALTQSLEVIKAAQQLQRTVNGVLADISNPIFRKYSSKITCTDVNSPPIDNLWPGMEVVVHCACSLAYQTGNPGSPARHEVSGSFWSDGHMNFYRPLLMMRVVAVREEFEEWQARNVWAIDLEEV